MCALESQYVNNEDDVTRRRVIVDVDEDSMAKEEVIPKCVSKHFDSMKKTC